jgi:hypothetical protein
MRLHEWTCLPSQYVLQDYGYGSMGHAIQMYHGGLPAFRELLAKAQGQPTQKQRLERLLHNYVATPKERIENVLQDYVRPA